MPDRIITFRQSSEMPEYRYLIGERGVKMGDYIYHRDLGRFFAIQKILHKDQLKDKHPVVIKTNNPQYLSIYNKDL